MITPFFPNKMGIVCLKCGEIFPSTKYKYEAHAKEHEIRKPRSGRDFLYFVNVNGEIRYYRKTHNSKKVEEVVDTTYSYRIERASRKIESIACRVCREKFLASEGTLAWNEKLCLKHIGLAYGGKENKKSKS